MPWKGLLGALLLLLPTLVLLQYFRITVDASIEFTARERCGLAYDAELRQALEFAQHPNGGRAVRTRLQHLQALEQQPCGAQSFGQSLRTTGTADALLARLDEHDGLARLPAHIHRVREDLGDRSNLILDPDLDTYYVVDFLLREFPAGLALLDPRQAAEAAALRAHLAQVQRRFAIAVSHNDYRARTRGTLETAIGVPLQRYARAIDRLAQGRDAAAREDARRALFALYDAAAQWEDRALQARIDDRRAWKLQTYAVVGAVLLLAAGFAWLTISDLVQRLMQLAQLSRRMARGELGLSVPVQGQDEVTQLEESFNAMAADLQRLYRDMEGRVRERTAAAQAAESRFRSVVEAAPDAILLANAQGEIVLLNAQAEQLFGYRREELLGRPIETLVPERLRGRHIDARRGFQRRPRTRAMGAGRELFGLRKDGREVPIEIGLNALHSPEGPLVLAAVIDISERRRAEELARAAEAHALRSAILDSLPASVIATDIEGRILAMNPAAERLLGHSREALIGRSSICVHDPQELQQRARELGAVLGREVRADFEVIAASLEHDGSGSREWTYIRQDGERIPVELAITALRDATGRISGFLKVASDISARKRAEAYIQHIGLHDPMTGLPNRKLFLDRLELALRQAQRHQHQVAVLLLDLDHFKHVNDTLGHPVGDQLLVAIADRLEHATQGLETLARLGGDEFALIVPEIQGPDAVAPLLARVTEAVCRPLHAEGQELQLNLSIGASLYPRDGDDAATLLKKADTAMYQAKARGRGTLQWFAESMLVESREKLALGAALRHALENDELHIHYQPEISLRTGRMIGLEALLRWRHEGEAIPPDRFIALAEDNGLILPLGAWVLRRACLACVELQQRLQRPLTMAVNVSPRQFQEPNWLGIVADALRDSGLNPNQLELEITENMLMQDPERSVETLRAIRRMGVGVVIDDFGTGYSSLAYLTQFPVDKLKIDRAFVRELINDDADAAVVGAILAMAQRLGLRVIAEGVETAAQHQYLRAHDCDEAQGFLYSPGIPAEDLVQRLAAIEAAAATSPAGESGAHAA